jgi:hypothetical protein
MDAFKPMPLPVGLILLGMLISLTFLYMSIPKSWEEAVKTRDDGSLTHSDSWARSIERKKSRYEVHDLYMLVAAKDSYFVCKHCPTGSFFLKKARYTVMELPETVKKVEDIMIIGQQKILLPTFIS